MSNYNTLKTVIDANIYQNGTRKITGEILNLVLTEMVNILGDGYRFAGIATTETDPGIPDAKLLYIANGKGTYNHFGGIEVTEEEIVFLYHDTEWHKVATGIASQAKITELGLEVIYDVSTHNNGAVFESLQSLLSSPNLSSLIPTSVRRGGMNIRFINPNNKYVQYHYTGTEITGNPNPFLDEANWQRIDGESIFEHSEVEVSILPNVLNLWDNIESLTISSFQGSQESRVNEYMLEFTVQGDNFTLTLPEGVRWASDPTWENGYTYQVSIVNNLAVFAGWEAQTNE